MKNRPISVNFLNSVDFKYLNSFVNVHCKGVQDRWEDVYNFAQSIFSEDSGSRFADYADGFSEV